MWQQEPLRHLQFQSAANDALKALSARLAEAHRIDEAALALITLRCSDVVDDKSRVLRIGVAPFSAGDVA